MQLSTFTQYRICQLLNQYLWNCLVVRKTVNHEFTHTKLNQLLCHLYPTEDAVTGTIQKLESLIQVYQQLNTHHPDRRENLANIQRQIFRLLGLRVGPILPVAPLKAILERSVFLFCFFYKQGIRQCARYNDEFYGLIETFSMAHRLQAYQFAWLLSERNVPFILTVSESQFAIWIHLRSPTYSVMLNQDGKILDRVRSLGTRLYREKLASTTCLMRNL